MTDSRLIVIIDEHGHKSATTDPNKIRRGIRKYPNANLAIVPADELIVLDVDGDAGRQTFATLKLRPTATVVTSRGLHAYYQKDGSFPSHVPKLAGIDVKAGGAGYILVPPSIHASGHEYVWASDSRIVSSLRYEQIAPTEPGPELQKAKSLFVAQGARNTTLTSLPVISATKDSPTVRSGPCLLSLTALFVSPRSRIRKWRTFAAASANIQPIMRMPSRTSLTWSNKN